MFYYIALLLYLISSFFTYKIFACSICNVSIESIDCILLSSFELEAILLISSVKPLYYSLLNLCCVFNLFIVSYDFLWNFSRLSMSKFSFNICNIFIIIMFLCIQWNCLYPYNTILLFHNILALHNHTKTHTLIFYSINNFLWKTV